MKKEKFEKACELDDKICELNDVIYKLKDCPEHYILATRNNVYGPEEIMDIDKETADLLLPMFKARLEKLQKEFDSL